MHPIDFGKSLEGIAEQFEKRMAVFRSHEGAGIDKFIDLGAHVYRSAAMCIDRFLTFSSTGMEHANREVTSRFSAQLKRLAASSSDFRQKPFNEFFEQGDEIARDLCAHVAYLNHVKKL